MPSKASKAKQPGAKLSGATAKELKDAKKKAEEEKEDDKYIPLHERQLIELEQVKLMNVHMPSREDKVLVERMSAHMMTAQEICHVLDISRSLFDKSLELQAAYQRGQSMGKVSLRRMQWLRAE